MREELDAKLKIYRWVGITPACAGRTQFFSGFPSLYEDHPRVCGKNGEAISAEQLNEGSPPRVREERGMRRLLHGGGGITPACAGRTKALQEKRMGQEDHPRVCGKNIDAKPDTYTAPGSPPRVREELLSSFIELRCARITPACAGRTKVGHTPGLLRGDHPRVCGKNL